MKTRTAIPWLAGALVSALLALPSVSMAQDDLDVTLRIVEDDQELDESFVNQLEIPESLEGELADSGPEGIEGLAGDVQDEMLEIESTLGEQSRETRDALDLELTGELDNELPGLEDPLLDDPLVDDPNLEDPLLDDPNLESPDLGLPDLQVDSTELDSLNSDQ